MDQYLSYYGWHFNKKMCKLALKYLPKQIEVVNKEKIDELLKSYSIQLENNYLYDYVYLFNYCLATYYDSSIDSESVLLTFIQDTLKVSEDGLIFTKWYAEMCHRGIPIEWEDVI